MCMARQLEMSRQGNRITLTLTVPDPGEAASLFDQICGSSPQWLRLLLPIGPADAWRVDAQDGRLLVTLTSPDERLVSGGRPGAS